jgi:hypothetical protein
MVSTPSAPKQKKARAGSTSKNLTLENPTFVNIGNGVVMVKMRLSPLSQRHLTPAIVRKTSFRHFSPLQFFQPSLKKMLEKKNSFFIRVQSSV